MSTQNSKLQVGIFVIAAAALGVVTLVWLGATKFFEETETFVTYFSESVQGLDPGSAVKFRGVPAGRVGEIRIAPDNNLIEVLLEIDTVAAKVIQADPTFRSKLELTGITGLRYIEIERRAPDEPIDSPFLSFDPSYPVIPSSQSRFAAIQTALADVYDRIMQVELKGISDDARTALQSVDETFARARDVVGDERVGRILDNLDQTAASAQKISANLEKATAALDLKPAITAATDAATNAKELFASLNRLTNDDITRAVEELAALAQSTQQVMSGLEHSIERLDMTVGGLRGLSDEVRGQPSRLLFQSPPEEEAAGGGR